jgi:hypothetical protein
MNDENCEETEILLPSTTTSTTPSTGGNKKRIINDEASSVPPTTTTSRPTRHFSARQRLAIPSLVLNAFLITFVMIYYTNRFLLSCEPSVVVTSSSSSSSSSNTWNPRGRNDKNATTVVGYVRYDKVIGHLHYAKTAGTEINGELAAHYERVCGHKG